MRTAGKIRPIRALVVEGPLAAREQLVSILQADNEITVIGHASVGSSAVQTTVNLRPDVVIFDVHSADRTCCQAIEQIMARAPTPILILSDNLDDRRSPTIVEALVAGALDALPRPNVWTPALETELRRTVRVIFGVHVVRRRRSHQEPPAHLGSPSTDAWQQVVVIGASTGGPSAIATVLSGLSGLTAPVLVVQHLHIDFTGGLVDWMARESALPVELAVHGQHARGGRVYVAPGGVHLRLGRGSEIRLDLEPETIHRPSVDQLFLSAAEHAGRAAVGVLLTGMGEDGAKGLLAIHERGGRTFAQDEESSAVFGMPAAARRLGAVSEMLSPTKLARAIVQATVGVPQ